MHLAVLGNGLGAISWWQDDREELRWMVEVGKA